MVKYSYLTLEDYWKNVIELRKAIPSPWTCQETNNDLFFMVCMSGRKEMEEYFNKVKKEVKFRVDHNIGKVPDERFRLIYTNVPLWFYMEIIDYFHQKGAVFALDNYPTTFWLGCFLDRLYKLGGYYEPNFEKPEEILAMRIVNMSAFRSLRHRMAQYELVAKEWSLDGAVFFANRTCPAVTRAVHLEERLFKETTGGLTMTFYGEHCDPRTFSEPQTKAKIDAFIEALEKKAAAKV
jgi:benzoyl-CoA reductase/2-hydroxyglutaryl-CoA dehydratase subunit BcrC/BadD/HgdB